MIRAKSGDNKLNESNTIKDNIFEKTYVDVEYENTCEDSVLKNLRTWDNDDALNATIDINMLLMNRDGPFL